MTLYPYRELTITSKVQECCGWEFAAKLGEFDYSKFMKKRTTAFPSAKLYLQESHFNPLSPDGTSIVHPKSVFLSTPALQGLVSEDCILSQVQQV